MYVYLLFNMFRRW